MRAYPRYPISDMKNLHPIQSRYLIFSTLIGGHKFKYWWVQHFFLLFSLVILHLNMTSRIELHTDGLAADSPGPSSCGGVFRMYMGFVRDCFAFPRLRRLFMPLLIMPLELTQSNYRSSLWSKLTRSILWS